MPWNSSTKVMTAPLNCNSNGDIQQATSYSNGNIGDCIAYGTICEWAKFKPIRSNDVTSVSTLTRYTKNQGFLMDTSSTGTAGAYSLYEIFSRYSATGGGWTYQRPRGASYNEAFRFYDFLNPDKITGAGYKGNAPRPWTYNNPTGSISSISRTTTVSAVLTKASGAEFGIEDMSLSGQASRDNLYYAVVYHQTGSKVCYLAKSTTKADALSNGSKVTVNIPLSGYGTYEGMWVITEATAENAGGDGTGYTAFLPYSKFTISFNESRDIVEYSLSLTSAPYVQTRYEYTDYGYMRIGEISFSSTFTRITFSGDNVSSNEGYPVDIILTPLITYNGSIMTGTPITVTGQASISRYGQTIDTTLIEDVMLTEYGKPINMDNVSSVSLIVQAQTNTYGQSRVVMLSGSDMRYELNIW